MQAENFIPQELGLKRMQQADVGRVLSCLREEIPNCLYLYIDVSVYGASNPNMTVWFDEDEQGVRLVVMKYHQSFQVYANRGEDCPEKIVSLAKRLRPTGISGPKAIIERVAPALCGEAGYKEEYGEIVELLPLPQDWIDDILRENEGVVRQAAGQDALEIARLICLDPDLGGQYTPQALAAQLEERMRTGMGRSWIIRRDGRVVAHSATFAECADVAVASGLIVHPDYRKSDCYGRIEAYPQAPIQAEKKRIFAFFTNQKLLRYVKCCGNPKAADYGKLVYSPQSDKA